MFFAQEELWQDQQESAREIHPIMEEKKPQEEILLNDTSSFQYKIGVIKNKKRHLGVHDYRKKGRS
jgi:hypothetical protein